MNSGETSLPVLVDDSFLAVSSYGLSSELTCGESKLSASLFLRALILSDYSPTLLTSFNLSYLLKAPSPNTVILGVRASTNEFELGGGW